jgi:hypothetical protein
MLINSSDFLNSPKLEMKIHNLYGNNLAVIFVTTSKRDEDTYIYVNP